MFLISFKILHNKVVWKKIMFCHIAALKTSWMPLTAISVDFLSDFTNQFLYFSKSRHYIFFHLPNPFNGTFKWHVINLLRPFRDVSKYSHICFNNTIQVKLLIHTRCIKIITSCQALYPATERVPLVAKINDSNSLQSNIWLNKFNKNYHSVYVQLSESDDI